MNTKTIILLAVLAVIAFVLYYFTSKANTTVTVDQKNTNTTTGLSALLNTGGGSNIIDNLFNLGGSNKTKTNTAPEKTANTSDNLPEPWLGIGGRTVQTIA